MPLRCHTRPARPERQRALVSQSPSGIRPLDRRKTDLLILNRRRCLVGRRLSRFGVGPKIVASVLASAALAGALSYRFTGACVVPAFHQPAVMTLAVILIVIGLPVWLIGAFAAMRAYNRDQLVTSGVFRLVRHPMYAAWIVLI